MTMFAPVPERSLMQQLPSFVVPAASGMPDPVVTYHGDGLTVERVAYHNSDGKLDRADGPATTQWHANGIKSREEWYQGGVRDCKDGPAITWWYINGVQQWQEWRRGGPLDRKDGPATTWWHANGNKCAETWYRAGKQINVPSSS